MLSIKYINKQQRPKFILNFSYTYGVGNRRLNALSRNLGINSRFFNPETKKKINIKIENFFRRFRYTFHLRNKKKKILSFCGLYEVTEVLDTNLACLHVDNALKLMLEQKKILNFFKFIYAN